MQKKYQEIRNPIAREVQEFVSRHLRLSTMQEERLELELNPQWVNHNDLSTSTQPTHSKQNSFHKHHHENTSFYNLVLLLFPQIPSEAPFDLHLMDTMFFLPDHTIAYIYRDSKRGLMKIKQRGIMICQAFLKRKLRKKDGYSRQKYLHKTKSTITLTDEKTEKTQKCIASNLDYFALLKYKDCSFLRLKEADLRSIFTNPLYANERFRHNNCTQYIQTLPPEESEEIRIHFTWAEYKNEALLIAAKQSQLGKVTDFGDRQTVRSSLQMLNPTVFLYFTIFELSSYISIHYNKRLESGHFHFVCEDDVWTLAGAQGIKVTNLSPNQYQRAQLWGPHKVHFGLKEDESLKGMSIFKEKPVQRSLLYQTVQTLFDQTNTDIKNKTLDFVKFQIDRVRRVEDQKLSKSIFDILHPGKGSNLYECLDCPQKLKKALNIKDRISRSKPLISVKENKPTKITNKSTILQQMLKRQQEKEQYVYRGIFS